MKQMVRCSICGIDIARVEQYEPILDEYICIGCADKEC